MRPEDHQKLNAPYHSGEDTDAAFARLLKVHLQEFTQLYDEINGDLDEKVFGVAWWGPHPGTKRRILISHYLLQCVKSVETNLIEAGLHHWEALDCWEKESTFLSGSVSLSRQGKVQIKIPPRTRPSEDINHRMAALHTVGFFRALVGALDCLGACIIGVLALPTDLRKASLTISRKTLDEATHTIQQQFKQNLDRFITEAGPTGWLEWITDFRNMAVHRGRRLHMAQLIPNPTKIYGPDHELIPRALAVEQLPSDPYLSQVEAFHNRGRADVLSESAADTMQGALTSSVYLLKHTGQALLDIWRLRRDIPSLLLQPKENWPRGVCLKSTGFLGYKTGSLPDTASQRTARLDVVRQFLTAALADHLRDRWDSFD